LHHVCPYQECLDNIFVVFESEEKLNAHLITKHKCTDTKSKMTKFLFSDTSTSQSGSINKKDLFNIKKNEFNFTNYINQLKENSKSFGENFLKNLTKKKEITENNNYREYKSHQNQKNRDYYGSEDPNYSNYHNNKKQAEKWGNKKIGGNYKNYNNDYHQNYNQQALPPQKPKSQNPNEIFDYYVNQENYNKEMNNNDFKIIEIIYTYENDENLAGRGKRGKRGRGGYGNGYIKQHVQENFHSQDINTIGLPPEKKKKKKFFNETKSELVTYKNEGVNNLSYLNTDINISSNTNQNKLKLNEANFNRGNNANFKQKPANTSSNSNLLTMDPNIDYKFVLKSWVFEIKDYLKEKISAEKIPESEFILPVETIFQMIIIIDKLEKQKMLELQSIINFGFDLEIVKEVRVLLLGGFYDKDSIRDILVRLDIKKILLLYKYIHISSNKLNGLYYKLGKK